MPGLCYVTGEPAVTTASTLYPSLSPEFMLLAPASLELTYAATNNRDLPVGPTGLRMHRRGSQLLMCGVLFAVALVLMVMGSVVLLVVNPETQGLVVGAAIVTGIAAVPLVAMTLLMRRRGPAPPMPSKGKRDGWCWIIGAHPSFIVALVNGNPPGAVFGLIGGQVVPHCSVTPAQGYPPVPAPPGSWH